MLVAGVLHSISRWPELAEMCPQFGAPFELDDLRVMVTDGESHFFSSEFADLHSPPEDMRVASAFAYAECGNCGPDKEQLIMAQSRGCVDRKKRDDRQNIQADPEVIELLWKHVADGPPKYFMLVRIPSLPDI